MASTGFLFAMFLVSSLAVAQNATDSTKSQEPLNLNPQPHELEPPPKRPPPDKSKALDRSLRKLSLTHEVCTIAGRQYTMDGNDDIEKCKAKGGSIQVVTSRDTHASGVHGAEPTNTPKSLNDYIQQGDPHVMQNPHYDPLNPPPRGQ